jgi:hypothetical protein
VDDISFSKTCKQLTDVAKKIQNEVTVLRKNNKYYLNETSEHATGKLCAWKKSN